ncbi:hypothetical protein PL75_04440 [Neisseria arctica]|uniref:TPM domain-containing protein n=1 Tax=Neisseria arctica TaxID=1470200 RepID=A0A0J0YSS0_9NEIS|nr:TPM domain-containing protein [Neisseria arctica]KLT73159.1 hypothetical protein PL75_04440 [Neisseria arctica]UOO87109.1 TPM domain-containing protein [Neisseria arctica]
MQEKNRFKRLWQHWLHPRWRVERYFPSSELKKLSDEIGKSELTHSGEIRFVIESGYDSTDVLKGIDTRTRAWQWFGELGVWDTMSNSGVLVYVSFADHAVEIVADRGIAAKVPESEWRRVCDNMLLHFRGGDFISGLRLGLRDIGTILARHFPQQPDSDVNELSNDVILR